MTSRTANHVLDLCLISVTCASQWLYWQGNSCVWFFYWTQWPTGDMPFSCIVVKTCSDSCSQTLNSVCVPFFFTFTIALLRLSTAWLPSTTSHCTMLSCPNPSCTCKLRRTKKQFTSEKSFSHHLQQSLLCKAFLTERASIKASTMWVTS
jgi:hypothetical protein